MKIAKTWQTAGCLAIGLVAATGAWAVPVTYYYSGSVMGGGGALFPDGTAMTGSLTYDNAAPNSYLGNFVGTYDPDATMAFTIGSTTFTTDAHGDGFGIEVIDQSSSPGYIDTFIAIGATVTAGPSPLGTPWNRTYLSLEDNTNQMFSSIALPAMLPAFSAFSNAVMSIQYGGGTLGIQLNSLTPAVPEPGSFVLLLLGLGGLGLLGRARR